MVYATYNELITGVYKPTYNVWGLTLYVFAYSREQLWFLYFESTAILWQSRKQKTKHDV